MGKDFHKMLHIKSHILPDPEFNHARIVSLMASSDPERCDTWKKMGIIIKKQTCDPDVIYKRLAAVIILL